MTEEKRTESIADLMLRLRQTRSFVDREIPADIVDELLQVARWSGSSKNSQPWQFVVVDDRETLKALSAAGKFTSFIAGSAMAIVIVMDGKVPRANAYDEGRVSERLMLAAAAHGIGTGTGWFSGPGPQQIVRELLGIPADQDVWSAVAFGYPDTSASQRESSVNGGRHPLAEIVSYGLFGRREG